MPTIYAETMSHFHLGQAAFLAKPPDSLAESKGNGAGHAVIVCCRLRPTYRLRPTAPGQFSSKKECPCAASALFCVSLLFPVLLLVGTRGLACGTGVPDNATFGPFQGDWRGRRVWASLQQETLHDYQSGSNHHHIRNLPVV